MSSIQWRRRCRVWKEAEEVGAGLARVLMETGAQAILDEIMKDRERRGGEDKSEAEVEAIENTMQGARRTQA